MSLQRSGILSCHTKFLGKRKSLTPLCSAHMQLACVKSYYVVILARWSLVNMRLNIILFIGFINLPVLNVPFLL